MAGILTNLGYDADQVAQTLMDVFNDAEYQILNALGQIGITGQSVINSIAGFFTGDGSYWLSTSDPGNLYIPLYLDVSGASTAAGGSGHPVDLERRLQPGLVRRADRQRLRRDRQPQQRPVPRPSPGDSSQPGTPLIQWPCTGDYGQQWYIGNGTYPGWSEAGWTAGIESRLNPGQNVDVYGASGSAGDRIDQWYWNGGWNQWWNFTQAIG